MNNSFIKKILPDPLLRSNISHYTFVDFPYEQTKQFEFKVLPSSHTRMILFLGEPSFYEIKNTLHPVDKYSLTGFVSKPHLFIPSSTLQQVMIHFTAWGAQQFVDFPLSEITDSRANLNFIFKQDLENLCERLHRDMALSEKIFALNRFFIHQLNKTSQIDEKGKAITQYILQANGTVRLQELCKYLFIGERTAQRLIHNTIGVNYKLFTKLVRLEYVRKLMTQRNITLTDVAMQAGYFDQAHFIHDFQTSFSESPGEYLKKQEKLVWTKIETT